MNFIGLQLLLITGYTDKTKIIFKTSLWIFWIYRLMDVSNTMLQLDYTYIYEKHKHSYYMLNHEAFAIGLYIFLLI
jgi:hypothetical protein